MRYYFAYGSNLWVTQMVSRCPDSRKIGRGVLHGYRWIINVHGYATIVPAPEEVVHGVVYTLSPRDEQNLDDYEEVANGLYQKCESPVELGEQVVNCLVYIDPVSREGVADAAYRARINYGLRDTALPESYVQSVIRKFVPVA